MSDEERESLYVSTIPRGIQDAKKIVFGRTFGDFVILLLLYGLCILLSAIGVLNGVGVLVGFVGSTVLMALVYQSAGDTPVFEHLRAVAHRIQLPGYISSASRPDGLTPPGDRATADGGRFEGRIEDLTEIPDQLQVWEEESTTAEVTRVKNVYPDFDIIEREDGAFITAMAVDGTSVFLQSKPAQNLLAGDFGQRAGDVDAPFSVFLTTKPFDIRAHKQAHMDARSHEQIEGNPILSALHEDYQNNILADERIRQTRRTEIYIIARVSPDEVEPQEMDSEMSPSFVDRIKETFEDPPDFTREELLLREEAFRTLEQRKSKMERLFSGIDGVAIKDVDYRTHLGEIRGQFRGPIDSQPVEVPASPIIPPSGLLDSDSDDDAGLMA